MKFFTKKQEANQKKEAVPDDDALQQEAEQIIKRGRPKKQEEETLDPRQLVAIHKERVVEFIRLQAEYNYLEKDSKAKAYQLKNEIIEIEDALQKTGYTNSQIQENRDNAAQELDEAFQ